VEPAYELKELPQCIVEFRSVSKRYGGHTALEDFSLEVWRGEFLTLLGPSGRGKTTILRLVAGFEQPQSGQILINGQDASPLPPHRRNVNTVFEHYALFPHLNFFRNVAFGLEQKKLPAVEIRKRVRSILEMVWCILPTARACRLRCQTATPENEKAFSPPHPLPAKQGNFLQPDTPYPHLL
jgi:ABC-type transporter Mla maintaining outer membrane lipid asymmetry ATPase subunit MlaF